MFYILCINSKEYNMDYNLHLFIYLFYAHGVSTIIQFDAIV